MSAISSSIAHPDNTALRRRIRNEETRELLFNTKPRPLKTETKVNNRINNLQRSINRLSVQMSSQVAPIVEALAIIQERQEHHIETTEKMSDVSKSILRRADTILKVSSNIKAITTETLRGVGDLKRRVGSGDPTLLRSLLLNEWFVLLVIFILHPYLPITIEVIGPIWGYIVSANFIKSTLHSLIVERRIELFNEGGPIRWAFKLALSAPHAIFLILYLTKKWAILRVKGNVTNYPFRASSLEGIFQEGFSETVQPVRDFITSNLSNVTSRGIGPYTVEVYEDILSKLVVTHAHIFEELRAIDPVLFEDRAGFVHVLAQYLAGKLYIVGETGVRTVLAAPSYIHQVKDVIDGEVYLYTLMASFFTNHFGSAFKTFTSLVTSLYCLYACNLNKYFIEEAARTSSWSSSSWVYAGLKVVTGLTASGCNCVHFKSEGGKHTKKNSRKHRTTRRNPRYIGGKLPNNYSDIILFSWEALLIYTSSLYTNGVISPTKEQLDELDTKGSEIFRNLILSQQYLPVIWLEQGERDIVPLLTWETDSRFSKVKYQLDITQYPLQEYQ
jgi:hypothetical protein